jgi:hypothetical protein
MVILLLLAGPSHSLGQTTPGAPAISSTSSTSNSITINRSAPSETGGSDIASYAMRFGESVEAGETVDWSDPIEVWNSGTGGSLRYVLENLEDGVSYDLQLRASNATTDGGWSSTASRTTRDHSGSTSSATLLTLGSSLQGRLHKVGDEDVFRILLTEVVDLWVYSSGELDAFGELTGGNTPSELDNDDSALPDHPLGFSIRHQATPGACYIRVSSPGFTGGTGSYVIHAQAASAPGASFVTATEIELNSITPGRIAPQVTMNG